MAGRALAKRLCQAAIGALIDWRKAGYDLARDATGEAFDRLFPDRWSNERRLLDVALRGFETSDLEDHAAKQLTAVASDLLLRHGLSAAEIAAIPAPDVPRWADRAMQAVCARGLRPSAMPGLAPAGLKAPDDNPLAEIDQRLERRLKALVARVYRQLLANLDTDLQVAFFGHLILDVGEIKVVVEETSENVRRIRDDVGKLVRTPASSQPPFSIPPPLSDFAGYEAEIEQICSALANGPAAISAVQGIGGVGKTELARKVADEMKGAFPDGQIHVDMLGMTDQPKDFLSTIQEVMRALGYSIDNIPPAQWPMEYQRHLNGRRILIFLDDVAPTSNIARLVPPRPSSLLITSRFRLALDGAIQVELERLSSPASNALLQSIYPALTPDEQAKLAELCTYLPLALRVAGSYLSITRDSVTSYLEEIQERRESKLAESADDIARPDLNPRIMLGHSFDRLRDDEPALAHAYSLLSLFATDFRLDGAVAILNESSRNARRILNQLSHRGLIQARPDGHFRFHELLREIVSNRVQPSARHDAMQRFVRYYTKTLERNFDDLFEGSLHHGLVPFINDMPNTIIYLKYAAENAKTYEELYQIISGFQKFAVLASLTEQNMAAEAAHQIAISMLRVLNKEHPQEYHALLANELCNFALFLRSYDRFSEALRNVDEALNIFSNFPDPERPEYHECLARTLAIRAECLSLLGFTITALKSVRMAIQYQGPLLLSNPDKYEQFTEPMINMYKNLCGIRGRIPDAQLLDPIENELEVLRFKRSAV